MKKLSVGVDSTLRNWIMLSTITFGADSKPTLYLMEKANESEEGLNEEVIADERQLLMVLGNMFLEEIKSK